MKKADLLSSRNSFKSLKHEAPSVIGSTINKLMPAEIKPASDPKKWEMRITVKDLIRMASDIIDL